jgi:hypothetical protein
VRLGREERTVRKVKNKRQLSKGEGEKQAGGTDNDVIDDGMNQPYKIAHNHH